MFYLSILNKLSVCLQISTQIQNYSSYFAIKTRLNLANFREKGNLLRLIVKTLPKPKQILHFLKWKKVPQTTLASPYTPGQTMEKSAPNHPGKPLHPAPPPLPYGQCPYGNNIFQKGASLIQKKIAPNIKPRWCWPKLYSVAGLYPQGSGEQSPICAENFGKIPRGGGGEAKPCCLIGLFPHFDILGLLKGD